MQQLSLILTAILLLVSCSNNHQATGNLEYAKKYQTALQSEIKETKCIAGLEIGQSEAQIDSIWKDLYERGLLIFFEDIDKFEAPVREKESYTTDFSYISFVHDKQRFYIAVKPKLIDDKLSELYCVIKRSDQSPASDKPTHILFSEIFENSERGRQFEKFIVPFDNSDEKMIAFIKDNMEILFYPQQDENLGTLHYRNVPDENTTPKGINSIEL